jgi:hypothetical protein
MRNVLTRHLHRIFALVLLLASGSAFAWPCDFLTGGGFIFYNGNKATFGVGGGCKDGAPTWGHLEYVDHGTGLNVHWTSITAYIEVDSQDGTQPLGARQVCGTARTNLYGDVDFVIQARDSGEPGTSDQFDIQHRVLRRLLSRPVSQRQSAGPRARGPAGCLKGETAG